MGAIFVSYRRDDSEGEAGRLFDDLVRQFGEGSVFMDVAGIDVGRDFRKAIDQSVATCDVLLAVIGKNWIDAKNEDGKRRLDDPSDFVRLETVAALKRDIPVIPVLVHSAKMPRADQLPDELKDLAYRNGVELTHVRWNSDLQVLAQALSRYVKKPATAAQNSTTPPPRLEPEAARENAPVAPWWKSRGVILTSILGAVAVVLVVAYLGWPRMAVQGPADAGKPREVEVAARATPPPASDASSQPKTGSTADAAPQAPAKKVEVAGRTMPPPATDVSSQPKTGSTTDTAPRAPVKKADESGQPPSTAPVTPASSPPLNPPPRKLPNFAGTWQLIEATVDGRAVQTSSSQPIEITQEGAAVRVSKTDFTITSLGTLANTRFLAYDGKALHEVPSVDGATIVETSIYKLDGSTLVLDRTVDYRAQFGRRPPGTEERVLKYQRVDAANQSAAVSPGPSPSSNPPRRKFPRFAGTWELFESTMNGAPQKVNAQKPLLITQNGAQVQIGSQNLTVTDAGTVTHKSFYAGDDKYGHQVATEAEADLVNTRTWRIEGSTLVLEGISDYKRRYVNHPPGTDMIILKYRRTGE